MCRDVGDSVPRHTRPASVGVVSPAADAAGGDTGSPSVAPRRHHRPTDGTVDGRHVRLLRRGRGWSVACRQRRARAPDGRDQPGGTVAHPRHWWVARPCLLSRVRPLAVTGQIDLPVARRPLGVARRHHRLHDTGRDRRPTEELAHLQLCFRHGVFMRVPGDSAADPSTVDGVPTGCVAEHLLAERLL